MSSADFRDHLLTLSFGLHSNPGAYAALVGAGVSRASGVPTAWQVLTDLCSQVARLKGASPSDPVEWYREEFGQPARYETVLENLAPRPIERQRLLRGYFDPDLEVGSNRGPTLAHRSLARLVKAGSVRVIITLNFDRLMEKALRELDVEPVVIATGADVASMAPLHTTACCVIHLHGDYLNPTSMLNTVEELSGYDTAMGELLARVLKEYGLVAAGWSSVYDPALRAAITAHYPSRYTFTWVEPGDLSEEAASLLALKNGIAVRATADDAFGYLADAVASMAAREARHPLSVATAAETAKRELGGGWVAIGLHDTLGAELAKLYEHPDLNLPGHQSDAPFGGQTAMEERLDEAVRVPMALVAALAYWGNAQTDAWWLRQLPRFAARANGDGLVRLLELPRRVGAALYWTAGVSAVASGRYDAVAKLLHVRVAQRFGAEDDLLAACLAGFIPPGNVGGSVDVLSTAIGVGSARVEEAWQEFEVIRLAWLTRASPMFAQRLAEFLSATDVLSQRQMEFAAAEDAGLDVVAQRQARAGAWREQQKCLGRLVDLVPAWPAHVVAARLDLETGLRSPVAERMVRELERQGASHELVAAGLGPANELSIAVSAASVAVGREASRFGLERVWADSGRSPDDTRRSSSGS